MSNKIDYDNLNFEKFRELAVADDLSVHEKVGFPDQYRAGREIEIFSDIRSKLGSLTKSSSKVLEIGPGCSTLPILLSELCEKQSSELHLVDSVEMLNLLPDAPHIIKWPGRFPLIDNMFESLSGKLDTIVVYSVIQYIFSEGNIFDFIDKALSLLTDGGELFIGDIPNVTMRKRFFSSIEGIQSHFQFTGTNVLPNVIFNNIEYSRIDDAITLAILARARASGFHAWVMPQNHILPMANRREDILIRKP